MFYGINSPIDKKIKLICFIAVTTYNEIRFIVCLNVFIKPCIAAVQVPPLSVEVIR